MSCLSLACLSTQEEFFHTFNTLHGANKQIILSSDRPPKDMDILEDRIRSRFEWGLLADIQSPDYETRIAILRKKQELDGYSVSDDVIEYIASNIKSNIRELEGALNKIIAYANLEKREINIDLAEQVLRDIISPNEKKVITPEFIIDTVADHFDITPSDIVGSKRSSKIVFPRQIAMYLCREMLDAPLTGIGKMMGDRDHTTVMHGIEKIEKEMSAKDSDADRGSYDKADTLYIVTRNGYILTEKQEIWSDSLHYYRAEDHVILRRDLQLDDAEHKVIAFGDYGEYWKEPGNAFLTRRPAVVSYDLSQGDSLFMRADSMYLFTINENALRRAAAAAKADSLARLKTDSALLGTPHHPAGELPEGRPAADSLGSPRVPAVGPGSPDDAAGPDSLARREVPDSLLGVSVPDSLAVPAVDPLDTLVGDARKAYLKEQAAKLKAAQKAAAAKARKEKLEEIAKKRQDKTTAKLLAQKEREERRLAARKLKAESKLRARQARAARKGKVIPVDSTALREIDSLIARNDREMDSLLLQMADSLAADSLAMRIPADSVDSLTDSADSVYRLMKGFRNVRIFRSDFQAVCDSMTAISTDSTIHLYINPVLWNQGNQITSDVMDIFTENQQITRAEFIGTPMMVSQLDTVHYNQVAGKQMTAWFRDNQIYRNDVNGNAQTIYYMQDGEPPQITGMGVIESGDCSFYIEDKQVVTIVYRKDPDWNIYPMDKIPADQELYLKGFKWEGARRPTQGAVFDRRVRPSQREEKRHLAHPDFPLLKALEERKKQLIEERRWADRNDQVDAATVEWMRALGFEVGQPRESGPKL